jgi:hypothetical protein
MSAQVQRLLGREVRYQVVEAEAIDVKVETNSRGKHDVELIDVSQGGGQARQRESYCGRRHVDYHCCI